jgi:endoglucanase
MIDIKLLSETCKIPGAPGFENRVRNFVIDYISPFTDEIKIDPMGNVIAIKKGTSGKKVMVAAHMDEISFITSHIDDDGFIRFHPLGGFDPKTLTAQRVIIHGKKDIMGVMGCKPIHIMKPDEKSKTLEVSDFYIDTGLPVAEVRELISLGDPITRERELIEMGDCVNSKSLDNRLSVYILMEVLRLLEGETIPFDLYAVFTVQEEVGIRGAIASSSGVNPDFGLGLDVTMAYDLPGAQPQEIVTKLGEGAAIKILDGSTICDTRMVSFLKDIAEKEKIKYQMELLPKGGTDTAGLQRFSNGGSIVGAISIPTRYLHQVIEMASKSDIENCIHLLKAAIKNMDQHDWSFR